MNTKEIKEIKEILDEFVKIVEEHKNSLAKMPGSMHLLGYFDHDCENSHSKTLAFLLNPKGNHRHGSEYLRSFLGHLRQEKGLSIPKDEEIDFKEVHVKREQQANGQRRIDIFVKLNKDTCLIIENKIWANDLPNQLKDYCDWATENYKKNVFKLYLTPNGSDPTEESIDEESRKEWEESHKYAKLSYAYDILSWLRRLHVRLDERILASGLEQYIHTLEVLTNQTEEERDMRTEILTLLTEFYKKEELTSPDIRLLGDITVCASAIIPILAVRESIEALRPDIKFDEEKESFIKDATGKYLSFRIPIVNPTPQYSDFKGCCIAYEHWIGLRTSHYYGMKKGDNAIDLSNFKREDWSADFPGHSEWWPLFQDPGEAKPKEIAAKIIALYDKIHGTS